VKSPSGDLPFTIYDLPSQKRTAGHTYNLIVSEIRPSGDSPFTIYDLPPEKRYNFRLRQPHSLWHAKTSAMLGPVQRTNQNGETDESSS
jgi:hypothetical protein